MKEVTIGATIVGTVLFIVIGTSFMNVTIGPSHNTKMSCYYFAKTEEGKNWLLEREKIKHVSDCKYLKPEFKPKDCTK